MSHSNQYPVTLEFDEASQGYAVSFVDIPEALTQGDTVEDALIEAQDALITAMDFYFEDKRAVPPSVWAKVLLLNEVCAQNLRPIDVAQRMGVRPQEVTRILDLHYATKIDTVAAALKAVGKELTLTVA